MVQRSHDRVKLSEVLSGYLHDMTFSEGQWAVFWFPVLRSADHVIFTPAMAISARNISKLYGEQKALDNVSFEIGDHEVVGFLGPNGAGKSTMMKILTCFVPPTTGDASVCGFDTRTHSMDVRRNVGYLPEHNPLYL